MNYFMPRKTPASTRRSTDKAVPNVIEQIAELLTPARGRGKFRFVVSAQCCGSGMFYPGSRSDHWSIPDPDPGSRIRGVKKHRIPDPTSFFIKAINTFCLLIPDPDLTIAPSRIRILDPGGKKAPDPGSATL
jgi:hypothetical protein